MMPPLWNKNQYTINVGITADVITTLTINVINING